MKEKDSFTVANNITVEEVSNVMATQKEMDKLSK